MVPGVFRAVGGECESPFISILRVLVPVGRDTAIAVDLMMDRHTCYATKPPLLLATFNSNPQRTLTGTELDVMR